MSETQFINLSKVIYSREHHFESDNLIRAVVRKSSGKKVQRRWRGNEDNAVAFGRRMLEVAIESARSPHFEAGKAIKYWEKLSALAKKAQSPLDQLLKHLKHIAKNSNVSLEREILLLASWDAGSRREALERKAAQKKASDDARALLRTLEFLEWLNTSGKARRDRIAAKRRNPGKRVERKFAEILMEGWIFLTGTKPSQSNAAFAGLLSAAWTIATGEDERNWTQAIRHCGKQTPDFLVSTLAEKGPFWK